MTGSRPRAPLIAGACAVALLLASAWLQVARETRFTLPASDDESLYLGRRATSRLVFAFRPAAADLYWIRAIQYYGGHRLHIDAEAAILPPPMLAAELPPALNYDQLFPLLDIATTLDPRFNIAYRFGAMFLSEPYPAGAGRPDLAVALLEKAVGAMPDRWEYLHDIGFVYYWDVHDYRKAAEYFNRAADRPGAPWWLRSLAATMLAKGGDRNTSRLLWRQLYESALDDRQRDAAAMKLRQLDALDQIDALQRIVAEYVQRTSARPSSWRSLVTAGLLRGVPLDPSGAPYELAGDGTVTVSRQSRLYPLPVEPAAILPGS